MSKPASSAPSGPTLSTSKISATVVLCVTCTPAQACGPRFSRCSISGEGAGLRRRAAAAPADPRRRHQSQRYESDQHLWQAAPDSQLLDAEPLAVSEPAIRHGQVLAPQAPREGQERLGLPLGAGHVLRLRIADPAVLVDEVGRQGRETGLADGPVLGVHSFVPTRSI